MQKIKRNNTEKGFEVVRIPTIHNGVIFYKNRTDLHKKDGFYDIVKTALEANQKYGELTVECLNDETMEAVYPILAIPPPTAQELYNNLKEEGKQVFQEFTNSLAEATLPRLIAGNVPSELQQLSAVLEVAKTRINTALDSYLANNDIENLKNFSFQTEEAEQLRQAIENFK